MMRVFSLSAQILCAGAIQAAMYNYTDPDDNSCVQYENERVCISEASQHVENHSKCIWQLSSHTCHFRQPRVSYQMIMIVAGLSAAMSVPIARYLEYMVIKFTIPTINTYFEDTNTEGSRQKSTPENNKRLFSSFGWVKYLYNTTKKSRVVPSEAADTSTPAALRKAQFHFHENSTNTDNNRAMVPFNVNRIRCISFINALPLEVELENLQRRLKSYADSLVFLGSLKDRSKLLHNWGMDETCEYVRSSFLVQTEPSWSQLEDRLDILVGRAVNTCRETAIAEMEILLFSPTITDSERVNRLFYLLQRDLLGSPLGMLIMERKFIRDAFYSNSVSYPSFALQYAGTGLTQSQLVILAVGTTLFCVAMVGYLLYFAIVQTPQRQRGWVSSVIIWLVLDFILVSSLEALLVNVSIPGLVRTDLNAVKLQLAAVTSEMNFMRGETPTVRVPDHAPAVVLESSSHSSEHKVTNTSPAKAAQVQSTTIKSPIKSPEKSPSSSISSAKSPLKRMKPLLSIDSGDNSTKESMQTFNSAQYFSIANRLARYFSDLEESKFILAYTSMLPPGQTAQSLWLRPLYHLIQQVDKNHVNHTKSLPRDAAYVPTAYPSIFGDDSVSLFCYFILERFLYSSFFMQNSVVQLIVTSLLFFLLLLHVQLYNAMPVLVVLPLALLIIVVCVYSLVIIARRTGKYFNEWNARRVAPFSEKAVKVKEPDEFRSEFEESSLDDADDLFENFGAPSPAAATFSSPIRVSIKTQPKTKGLVDGASKAHYAHMNMVHPSAVSAAADTGGARVSPVPPLVLGSATASHSVPVIQQDGSSSGSDEEKSDSSDFSTDDSDNSPSPQGGFPLSRPVPSMQGLNNPHSNDVEVIPLREKLRARTKLPVGVATSTRSFSSPLRTTAHLMHSISALDNRNNSINSPSTTPTRSSIMQGNVFRHQNVAEAKNDARTQRLNRAERLMALVQEDIDSPTKYKATTPNQPM